MHIKYSNIATTLSNHIKNYPLEFSKYTAYLTNKFVLRLKLGLPAKENAELKIIYQFIFMYSLITSDLNNVKRIMYDPKMIVIIIKALIIDGNLKLKQNLDSVNFMVDFGHKYVKTLSSYDLIAFACCCFDSAVFHTTLKYMVQNHCNNEEFTK